MGVEVPDDVGVCSWNWVADICEASLSYKSYVNANRQGSKNRNPFIDVLPRGALVIMRLPRKEDQTRLQRITW
jgi:hypothetical protein